MTVIKSQNIFLIFFSWAPFHFEEIYVHVTFNIDKTATQNTGLYDIKRDIKTLNIMDSLEIFKILFIC